MKNHPQNNSNKSKKAETIMANRKRGSFSQAEGSNDNKKKVNSSPQKSSETKKDIYKHDKNNMSTPQQNQDTKDSGNKKSNNIIKTGNNTIQTNNYISNFSLKNTDEIKDKQDRKKNR